MPTAIRAIIIFYLIIWGIGFYPNSAHGQQVVMMLPFGHTSKINAVVFSPDGTKIVTASNDRTTKIWDVKTGSLLASFGGNRWPVTLVQFSGDGKELLTVAHDSIKVWSITSGSLVRSFGCVGDYQQAFFSANGLELITVDKFYSCCRWNITTGTRVWILPAQIVSTVYDPLREQLFTNIMNSGYEKYGLAFNAITGKPDGALRGHNATINSVTFSPDSLNVVTASNDSTSRIWDRNTASPLDTFRFSDRLNYALLSPNRAYLLVITDGGTAIVRDVKSHNVIVSFETKLRDHYRSLIIFSADSKKVFFASLSNVEIWDITKRHLLIELQGDRNLINDMCISADGRMLVTGGNNKVAELWDISRWQFVKSFKGAIPAIETAHFSDSGNMLDVVTNDSTVRVWDTKLVKPLYTLKGPETGSLNYSKIYDTGSKLVAGGNETVFTWNLANGKLIDHFRTSGIEAVTVTPNNHVLVIKDNKSLLLGAGKESDVLNNSLKQEMDALKSVEFADSGRIAALRYDHKIKIVQLPTGRLLYTFSSGNNNRYSIAEIAGDGSKIITCLQEPKKALPVVWEAQTGRKLFTLKIPKIEDNSRIQTKFSPDAKHLFTIHYSQLNLWNAVNGNLEASPVNDTVAPNQDFEKATFTPNSSEVITTMLNEKVAVWNVITGDLKRVLSGNESYVKNIDPSPNGKWILTGAEDLTCRLWDAESGRLLVTFVGFGEKDYIVFDNYGRFDGTSGAIEKIYFTSGLTPLTKERQTFIRQLWVPGLAARLMNGQDVDAPHLKDLKIN